MRHRRSRRSRSSARSAHDRGRLERARAISYGAFVAIRLRPSDRRAPPTPRFLPRQTCACAIERSTLRETPGPHLVINRVNRAIPSRSDGGAAGNGCSGMIRLCGHVAPHSSSRTAQTSLHRSPIGLSGLLQVLAKFPGDGWALAMPATRTNAVQPTAIAPITENICCQASDGMACFTMPWVA